MIVPLPPGLLAGPVAVDDEETLFLGPSIHDWSPLTEKGIDVVVDLEGGLDHGVPTLPNTILYVYFPIYDEDLPDKRKLHAIAALAARLLGDGHRVLCHCGFGLNRSALVAGLVLVERGWTGSAAVSRLRERRPGALFNEVFADYLGALPAGPAGAAAEGGPAPRLSWRGYEVDTDPRRLDLGVVHAFLTESYWAAGVSREVVERSVQGSLCFGAYHGNAQVGFARVVTDRATFAYLADVFVVPEHRGRGVGALLLGAVRSHPGLQGLRRWSLVTRDAHGLYERFGFTPLGKPEGYMEILDADVYRR